MHGQKEVVRIEGLREHRSEPSALPGASARLRRVGGDCHHRDVGAIRQRGCELSTGHTGQSKVRHDQIGSGTPREKEPHVAVGGLGDVPSSGFEKEREDPPHSGIVFYEQDLASVRRAIGHTHIARRKGGAALVRRAWASRSGLDRVTPWARAGATSKVVLASPPPECRGGDAEDLRGLLARIRRLEDALQVTPLGFVERDHGRLARRAPWLVVYRG